MISDQIALGRFGSPYGIKGWIKVISYTDPVDNILDYLPWCVFKNDKQVIIEKIKGKIHGHLLVVQFAHCQDRDVARTYTNLEIYINKEQLPAPANGEYYWIDLVGLTVINRENEHLGKVERLFATGSNDVVVVKEDNGTQRYVPYIQDVIIEVDLENKKLIVDWDPTF